MSENCRSCRRLLLTSQYRLQCNARETNSLQWQWWPKFHSNVPAITLPTCLLQRREHLDHNYCWPTLCKNINVNCSIMKEHIFILILVCVWLKVYPKIIMSITLSYLVYKIKFCLLHFRTPRFLWKAIVLSNFYSKCCSSRQTSIIPGHNYAQTQFSEWEFSLGDRVETS